MAADYKTLLSGSLRLLSVRPRSEDEIRKYLHQKTSDGDLINHVIDQLKSSKFIDDEKFAKWLIDSRSRTRPRGKRRLIMELKDKGITPDESLISQVDEDVLAQEALEKKMRHWKSLPYRDFRTKAGRFLFSRGFSWSAIEKAIKTLYNLHHVS